MPFLAPLATLDIVAFGASSGIAGTNFMSMASAVAEACALQFAMPGIGLGNLTGVSGPGVVSSSGPMVGYDPASMATSLISAFSSAGIVGVGIPSISSAISSGICKNLPMLIASGASPIVSSGAGVGKLVGFLQPSLYGLLISQATMKGLLGTETPRFMYGLSTGLCSYLTAVATIPLVSVGAPVPPPPAGPIPAAGPVVLVLI